MPVSKDRILFDDEHLLVVNKRSLELTVKGAGKVQKLPLLDYLKEDYPELQTLHRLDFETSGIVVFAKTKEAFEAIRESNFAGWEKGYSALVMGRMERSSGVIRKKLEVRGQGSGKKLVEAETRYKVIGRYGNSSLVEAFIETGRYHQIRKHFAAMKHPLVLDEVYGHKRFNKLFTQEFGLKRFFLHAHSLTFPHPITGEKVEIECSLPPTFKKMVKYLKSLSS